MLTPKQIEAARHALGRMWELGRPLSHRELGACLEFNNPDRARDLERSHDAITGPVSVALCAMLAGYIPDEAPEQAWKSRRADPKRGVATGFAE